MADATFIGVRHRHRGRRIRETSIRELEQVRRNVVLPILHTIDNEGRMSGAALGSLRHMAIRALGDFGLVR